MQKNHPYHLVDPSPWPFFSSLSALMITMGLVKWFKTFSPNLLIVGVISIIFISFQWWRDISRESTFQGLHTIKVTSSMKWGMILFITSEVLFFFSFFWAFFHSSLSPTIEIGMMWPPKNIQPFDPFEIPILNTSILLASGATVTWTHHSMMNNLHKESIQSLTLTILLGIYFSILQGLEYYESPFSISDSVYGSTFFIATGFHGLHVIIGTIFLSSCLTRMMKAHFSPLHHFGFEAAAWYWHFVDVVWLFLFSTIYWWGS